MAFSSSNIVDLTSSDDEGEVGASSTNNKTNGPPMGFFTTSRNSTSIVATEPRSGHKIFNTIDQKPNLPITPIANGLAAKHNTHKRSAREAFGRNGVSELLSRAEADLTRVHTSNQSQGLAKQPTNTPGRTSINDLLSRSSEETHAKSPTRAAVPNKRPRSEHRQDPPRRVPLDDALPSPTVASLLERAREDFQNSRSRPKPDVVHSHASVNPAALRSFPPDAQSSAALQAFASKARNGAHVPSQSPDNVPPEHRHSHKSVIDERDRSLRKQSKDSMPRKPSPKTGESGQKSHPLVKTDPISDPDSSTSAPFSKLISQNAMVAMKPTVAPISNPTPRPKLGNASPKGFEDAMSTSKTHNVGSERVFAPESKKPNMQESSILKEQPHARQTTPNSKLGTPTIASPTNGVSLQSPRPIRLPTLPSLEGSPRIVKLRDPSPKSPKGIAIVHRQSSSGNPDQRLAGLPVARMSPIETIAPASITRPDSAGPIRESIEIVPPVAPLIRPLPSATTTALADASAQSMVPRSNKKFYKTNLTNRAGRPWTDAEVIMACYLSEVLHLPWGSIDKKLDRGYNTVNTKYSRIPTGLKNDAVKIKMRWLERKRAIDAMLNTLDLDMEQMIAYLQKFIETDSLPSETAQEYERLSAFEPGPVAAGVSILHDKIVVSDSGRSSPASDHLIFAATRKRRGMAEGQILSGRLRPGARLADGQLDVKQLYSRRQKSSPDSVLVSSDHDDKPRSSLRPAVTQKQQRLLDLADQLSDRDEDLSGLYKQRKKPYLSSREREVATRAIKNESQDAETWQGMSLHVDIDVHEIVAIIEAVKLICPELYRPHLQSRLRMMLASATKAQLAAIAACAAEDGRLGSRTRRSIRSFLEDTISGVPPLQSTALRIGRLNSTRPSERIAPAKQLLHRELDTGHRKNPRSSMRDAMHDTMNVTHTFTGASGDVGNLAWQPRSSLSNGTCFGAGSACLVDPSSMQYNQPNNLLFGNVDSNILYELPDHHRLREKPTQGVNATHSMHVSQDSRLFMTVSMVDFSRDGRIMFSVGYDNHLRSFRIDSDRGNCNPVAAFDHETKIDLLAMNKHTNALATGAQDIHNGIRIFRYDTQDVCCTHNFWSPRASNLVDKSIFPSALKWGTHSLVSQYLLAGFSSTAISDINANAAFGETCLWDVEKNVQIQVAPAAGNVFDASWNPNSSHLATACASFGANNVNRGTKSLVRVYNALQDNNGLRWTTRGLEMECPAFDINDVIFNPYNDREIVAGATNGSIYLWDMRRPNEVLHKFEHGEPLMELDPHWPREQVDTGVRFCTWGDRAARLYTGSSDGVLKVWDARRATEDALVRDVVTFNSGIMSGAFTEDFSKLLIGEVNGSINLLEVGADPKPFAELGRFTLAPFEAPDSMPASAGVVDDADSGIVAARKLVKEGQIHIRPLGGYPKAQAVQGSMYSGPHDQSLDAPMLRQRALAFQKSMTISEHQCNLALCKDAGRHFPIEEIDDSGRSKDRIPQAMRDAIGKSRHDKVPNTMLKCTHCDAPARVREDDMSQAAFPLCERCSFACLRCGQPCKKISPSVETIACRSCGLEWDVGVLGCKVRVGAAGDRKAKQKTPAQAARFEEREGFNLAEDGAFGKMGDLFDLMSEYHHSLWEDQEPVVYRAFQARCSYPTVDRQEYG